MTTETAPRQVTGDRLRAAISSIGAATTGWLRAGDDCLSRAEQSVLRALVDVVDWGTWCRPTVWGKGQGVSVARLGDRAGYRPRRTTWALAQLEARGLIEVDRRPPLTSQYKVVATKVMAMATVHLSRWNDFQAGLMRRRQEAWRKLMATGRRVVARVADGAADFAPDTDTDTVPQAVELPRWAFHAAAKARLDDVAPEVSFQVTAELARQVYGEGIDPTAVGGDARAALQLWDERGRPDVAELATDLGMVVQAVREAPGARWLGLRGQGRGRGKDRRTDFRYLTRASAFGGLLAAARQWLQGRAAAEAPPAPPMAPVSFPPLTVELALADSGLAPVPGSATEVWSRVLAELATEDPTGLSERMWGTLVTPSLDQGALSLQGPHAAVEWFRDFLTEPRAARATAAAGRAIRLTTGPPPTD